MDGAVGNGDFDEPVIDPNVQVQPALDVGRDFIVRAGEGIGHRKCDVVIDGGDTAHSLDHGGCELLLDIGTHFAGQRHHAVDDRDVDVVPADGGVVQDRLFDIALDRRVRSDGGSDTDSINDRPDTIDAFRKLDCALLGQ